MGLYGHEKERPGGHAVQWPGKLPSPALYAVDESPDSPNPLPIRRRVTLTCDPLHRDQVILRRLVVKPESVIPTKGIAAESDKLGPLIFGWLTC